MALTAVEQTFLALDAGEARNFPLVRERLEHVDAYFGVKSGVNVAQGQLGLKTGGYWSRNAAHGRTNHQAVVVLLDIESGRVRAIVGGNHITALRTAAASALSVKLLARTDSRVLGVAGAGEQAVHHIRAIVAVRAIDRVLCWSRSPERIAELQRALRGVRVPIEPASLETLARRADILVTVTTSTQPLIERAWVRDGVHICAAGADTAGKQELDVALVTDAIRVTDEIEQAITIGECQHAFGRGLIDRESFRGTLGAVARRRVAGRSSDAEVTLFDSTGVALQDLGLATLVADRAIAEGRAVSLGS